MKATIQLINPEIAKAYLALNDNNRPVSNNSVSFLAGEMITGRWQENGSPIRFSGCRLLDGQHRLLACIKAGYSFRAVVVNDLDDDTFLSIDTGLWQRTAGQILTLGGKHNGTTLAAALVLVDRYNKGILKLSNCKTKYSAVYLNELVGKYPEIELCTKKSKLKATP